MHMSNFPQCKQKYKRHEMLRRKYRSIRIRTLMGKDFLLSLKRKGKSFSALKNDMDPKLKHCSSEGGKREYVFPGVFV